MEDSAASPMDSASNVSTPSAIGSEIVVSNKYRTKDHWVIIDSENQQTWICLHCREKKYSKNTSRSHLKEHTLKCPNSPLYEAQSGAFQQLSKEDMDKSIVDFVVGTGISFNTFDNPLFHKMVRNLRFVTSSYKVPHSTTISRYLSGNVFDLRFNFIKDILAKFSGQISLTCDGWHSTVHKCHYVVVTGSWVSDDWKIVNIILTFRRSGQTAEDILSVIMNTLEEYGIKNKIFALTMDNTTTNKAVSRLLQNELQNTGFISIGLSFFNIYMFLKFFISFVFNFNCILSYCFFLGCMCHILNLVVKEGLKEISQLQKKVHSVMKYLANPLSSGRLEVLGSHCRIAGIKFLRPILEIDIRWNSTLAMFERYLHLHPAISEMCSKDTSIPSCLDNESFIILESLCRFLKPFENATLILSKERSNSISDAIMIILEISQHINKARNNDMIRKMKKKFEKYWKIVVDHIVIAHVLDPRYKFDHLKATLIEVGGYSENDAELFVKDIRHKIISNGIRYTSAESSAVEIVETGETVEAVEIDDNSTSEFLFPRRIIPKKRKLTNSIEHELELYENEPLEEFANNNEKKENLGLFFWKSLSQRFPTLSRMARDYLSIKPSSVSSERAFSRAGFTITPDRANISEKTVSSTILMHSWLMESQNQFSPLNDLP